MFSKIISRFDTVTVTIPTKPEEEPEELFSMKISNEESGRVVMIENKLPLESESLQRWSSRTQNRIGKDGAVGEATSATGFARGEWIRGIN